MITKTTKGNIYIDIVTLCDIISSGSDLMDKKNKLIYYRNLKGYTKMDMANKLSLPYSSYSYYESGKRTMSYDTALQIAKELDKKVEDIFLPERFTVRNN